MSHEIEQFDDGTAAFFSARQDAWHQLGTVTKGCLTAEEAMSTAHLSGWNVRKTPLATAVVTGAGVTPLTVPGRYATVRTHPRTGEPEVLGVVGKDYTPVQNEDCAELLNLLVDASDAHFETAGSLRGGRQVFVTMKLPAQMRIAGVDNLDLYLAATTSHDGSTPLRVDATPIRIVCANTQLMALRASQGHYSFRHTRGSKNRVHQARTALGLMWDYFEAFEKAAERMLNEPLTSGEFDRIVSKLWTPDHSAGKRAYSNRALRESSLRYLFSTAGTQENIRYTRWGGYQAIVEYLDHVAPAPDPLVRASRVLTASAINDTKQAAYRFLSV